MSTRSLLTPSCPDNTPKGCTCVYNLMNELETWFGLGLIHYSALSAAKAM